MGIAPSGHAGELDSIFDDVMDFAICKGLRLSRPQIGNSRIEIQANLSLPAAVDSMATRTLAQKVFPALLFGIGGLLEWILFVSFGCWDGEISHPPSETGFQW